MSDRLGGALARKPLHFIFVLDVSGSMLRGGRIQALNNAITEVLPHLKDEARANPHAESAGAGAGLRQRTAVGHRATDPGGPGALDPAGGRAARVHRAWAVRCRPSPAPSTSLDESHSAFPPAIILVSDGRPTQSSGVTFAEGLQALLNNRWGATAVRLALGVGRDADMHSMRRFIGDEDVPLLRADNPEQTRRVHRLGLQGRQQGRLAPGRRPRHRCRRRAPEPGRRPDLEHPRMTVRWTTLSGSSIGSVHVRDESAAAGRGAHLERSRAGVRRRRGRRRARAPRALPQRHRCGDGRGQCRRGACAGSCPQRPRRARTRTRCGVSSGAPRPDWSRPGPRRCATTPRRTRSPRPSSR
ncbi:hypothetical protein [Nocardioides convexus]|uniref:vWA domain-containing protein n=1 Tax=Nocardioides convexus TaxID=2712224 RepID=UPI002418434E|nr:hypothetical protein [Nocardioides convexus]